MQPSITVFNICSSLKLLTVPTLRLQLPPIMTTDDMFLPKATDTAVTALQLLKMMTTDDLFFPIFTDSVVTALQLLTVISLHIECSFLLLPAVPLLRYNYHS